MNIEKIGGRYLGFLVALAAILPAAPPCGTVSNCAYQLLNQRVVANQSAFYVYLDADSAFNHGFASGLFFSNDVNPQSAVLDPACVDAAGSATGCSTDPNALDRTRGTVFRFSFPALGPSDFIGVNFQDPQGYTTGDSSAGYNLTPATAVQFDVRSPGGVMVQFGVGGCVTGFYKIESTWETLTIPLDTLHPPPVGISGVCPPDITNVHILFTVATNGAQQPRGSSVLLDNITFTPVPTRQMAAPSLPLSTQTFGIVPQTANSIPPDQANRNIAAIYESALTILTLLHRGQRDDVANALHVADTLDYALNHENHGDPILVGSDGSTALHNAYMAGDIGLLNQQSAQGALAGDVRLAGFTGGSVLCGSTGFCLVLDGATGGNNAWAMLALIAAYLQSGRPYYLADAKTIGAWIINRLQDRSTPSFGGYLVGFSDFGPDGLQQPNLGKSTENNGDIFAAFSLLSQIEAVRGNAEASQQWLTAANVAGDFVKAMSIPGGGFYVGTVTSAAARNPGAGVIPSATLAVGNDVVNTYEFLDSDTFTLLPMAAAPNYSSLDWAAVLQHVLNYSSSSGKYTQTVTAAGQTYQGFDLVPAPAQSGVAFEFTGQMATACAYLDILQSVSTFQNCASTYLSQIQTAQRSAPFTDGLGLVASVLQNGGTLAPVDQALPTPFQEIPERVGLAATNWAIIADQRFNPMAYSAAFFSASQLSFSSLTVGASGIPEGVTLTNAGTTVMTITGIAITGSNPHDFLESDNCVSASPLAPGASCRITVTFSPTGPGNRSASLTLKSNAVAGPLSLAGSAVPVDDFSISVTPGTQNVNLGQSVSYAVSTVKTAGASQSVALSVSGLPAGASSTIADNPIMSGSSTALTISTTTGTAPGSVGFTVLGTGTEVSHLSGATISIQPAFEQSAASITFSSETVGVTSVQQGVTISNPGEDPLPIAFLIAGPSSSEFIEANNCPTILLAGMNCNIALTFTPAGTGPRSAFLLIQSSVTVGQQISLSGTGLGACMAVAACANKVLVQRAMADSNAFFAYKDDDSSFNHGIPILYGNPGFNTNTIAINAGCIDSPNSSSGCSADSNAIDLSRGTVFSITFPAGLTGKQYAGMVFLEPSNYMIGDASAGYNLTPDTAITFDVRAPQGATVQFGVGVCATPHITLVPSWTTMRIELNSLIEPGTLNTPCSPDLTNVHQLFSITADATFPAGGPVLLDNIQLASAPFDQSSRVSLPLSTQTFGVTPTLNYPIPTDEVNRNLATTYESALTVLALLTQGVTMPALTVADALDYALHHDNHGDSIPPSGGSTGLHSAYEAGDLAFLNAQSPSMGTAQKGDVRLSGFSASSSLCGTTQFCLVLDGATGGNNAWAILALATAYVHSGTEVYLADAESIGNWIVAALTDTSGSGYGGYFLGYSDGGAPKELLVGKSTEQNAEIFAAFNLLAQIEEMRGNSATSEMWASHAKTAGDFVARMFDTANGRFNTGTVNNVFTTGPAPGICPSTTQVMGFDTVNTCDFLDANTAPILAMSGAAQYNSIDWSLPVKYLSTFGQTIAAAGNKYQGFGLVPPSGAAGVGWEFTSQAITAYRTGLIPSSSTTAASYLKQVLMAQNSAPFGDGLGLVAATLPNGDAVAPATQCISTPFQCIPERVGLAATAWAVFAELGLNPLAPHPSSTAIAFSGTQQSSELARLDRVSQPLVFQVQPETVGSSTKTVLLTNTGIVPVSVSISLKEAEPKGFSASGCTGILGPGMSCPITVVASPLTSGDRTASLSIAQTPSWATRPSAWSIELVGRQAAKASTDR